jgi:hypothetical protein
MGFLPDRVTTDGHGSYPRAIRMVLGPTVPHRTSAFWNNRLQQDHRGIKGRIRPMRGFKNHQVDEHPPRHRKEGAVGGHRDTHGDNIMADSDCDRRACLHPVNKQCGRKQVGAAARTQPSLNKTPMHGNRGIEPSRLPNPARHQETGSRFLGVAQAVSTAPMQQARAIDGGYQREESLHTGRFRIARSEPPADA